MKQPTKEYPYHIKFLAIGKLIDEIVLSFCPQDVSELDKFNQYERDQIQQVKQNPSFKQINNCVINHFNSECKIPQFLGIIFYDKDLVPVV
jgi:hypothetical protein